MKTTLILPCKDEPAKDRIVKESAPYVDEIIVVENMLYGQAYKEGFKKANTEIIIGFDCDGSYDPGDIPRFLLAIQKNDFVLGNRFHNMDKGAMKRLNYLGNSLLRQLLKLRGVRYNEVCTGFFAIKKDKIPKLESNGFEFSSELLIKTKDLKCKEIPIRFHRREGESKLKRFRDGLRHFWRIVKSIFK